MRFGAPLKATPDEGLATSYFSMGASTPDPMELQIPSSTQQQRLTTQEAPHHMTKESMSSMLWRESPLKHDQTEAVLQWP